MFRALLAHPQEALHKHHVMSVGCTKIETCSAPPEDEQVMLETCRGP
jgi:hypothetical protein